MVTPEDEDEARITLRLPRQLHDEMKRQAEEDRRSLNTMIIVALEQWLQGRRKQEADDDTRE